MAFKDYFIKSDETAQTAQPATTTKTAPVHTQVASSEAPATQSVIKTTPAITSDDQIVDMLWKKIIEQNRPGPDYLELKNNIDALNDLPISEDQKIMSAFKVLKNNYPSFKKEDILKAIDFYINVVKNEKSEGEKQLNQLRMTSVDGVENEIKNMQVQADQLKKQYETLQASIAEKTLELTRAKSDIEQKSNAFNGSIDAVINVLESDKQNITSINF